KEKHKAKTLIIPETILSTLFGEAVKRLEKAEELLQSPEGGALLRRTSSSQQHYDIRDACMIIILTTSGIRVHELASIKTGGCYTVQSNSNERYYWMQGRSEKTYEGDTEWLVCNMTYRALQIAEEIAFPLQETLSEQIKKHEKILLNSMEAQELRRYQKALFLGKSSQKTDEIKPLSNANILYRINQFAQRHDIDWHFTPHQFRRTFANYAARSAYGDLRYLRDHFKHWSLDMTILYAMNEQQDVELYDEIMVAIKNEKIAIVEHWLEEDTLLAGGMAGQVRSFRSKTEAVRTYNTRVQLAEQISQQVHIRATTVAWCTADNTDCSGRGVADNTRCGECNNAIIDDRKKAVWVGIHNQQLELRDVDDIGEPGRLRVERDIKRCELVLKQLNVNVENRNPVKA
ncbi:MAG: integrase, partial [Planctomycetota bacterium]